jgi:hypothetical protein
MVGPGKSLAYPSSSMQMRFTYTFILSDTGEVANNINTMLLQGICRADTGNHQQLGRVPLNSLAYFVRA